MSDTDDVAVVIPAKNEAARIGPTVTAARSLPGVRVVVVVDDGSTDSTARVAEAAGATTIRHSRNRGKGAAMVSGAEAVRLLDQYDGRATPRHLLFLDADLQASAAGAAALVGPVRGGRADMTVAVLVGRQPAGGGRGYVVGLA
ncbi:MAG TPA: glycosyltransferase, partial [Cryptosporangiaceae bacterium]|nr:glycosyltransferase [Cryptosporangiaceae bacterium]